MRWMTEGRGQEASTHDVCKRELSFPGPDEEITAPRGSETRLEDTVRAESLFEEASRCVPT